MNDNEYDIKMSLNISDAFRLIIEHGLKVDHTKVIECIDTLGELVTQPITKTSMCFDIYDNIKYIRDFCIYYSYEKKDWIKQNTETTSDAILNALTEMISVTEDAMEFLLEEIREGNKNVTKRISEG